MAPSTRATRRTPPSKDPPKDLQSTPTPKAKSAKFPRSRKKLSKAYVDVKVEEEEAVDVDITGIEVANPEGYVDVKVEEEEAVDVDITGIEVANPEGYVDVTVGEEEGVDITGIAVVNQGGYVNVKVEEAEDVDVDITGIEVVNQWGYANVKVEEEEDFDITGIEEEANRGRYADVKVEEDEEEDVGVTGIDVANQWGYADVTVEEVEDVDVNITGIEVASQGGYVDVTVEEVEDVDFTGVEVKNQRGFAGDIINPNPVEEEDVDILGINDEDTGTSTNGPDVRVSRAFQASLHRPAFKVTPPPTAPLTKEQREEARVAKVLDDQDRMRFLYSNFSEEQRDRYAMYRRSVFSKAAIKKIMQRITGNAVHSKVVIAMSGLAKILVSDVMEEALDYKTRIQEEEGPVLPKHLREAVRKLGQKGQIPKSKPKSHF